MIIYVVMKLSAVLLFQLVEYHDDNAKVSSSIHPSDGFYFFFLFSSLRKARVQVRTPGHSFLNILCSHSKILSD